MPVNIINGQEIEGNVVQLEGDPVVVEILPPENYEIDSVTLNANVLTPNEDGYYEVSGEGELQYCVSPTGHSVEFRLASSDDGLSRYNEITTLPFIDLATLSTRLNIEQRVNDSSTPTVTVTLFDNSIDYRQIILDNIEVKDTNGNVLYSPTANRIPTTDDYGRTINFDFNLNAVTQDIIVEFTTSYCILSEVNLISTSACRIGIDGVNNTGDQVTEYTTLSGTETSLTTSSIGSFKLISPEYSIGFDINSRVTVEHPDGTLIYDTACGMIYRINQVDCNFEMLISGGSNPSETRPNWIKLNELIVNKNNSNIDTNPALSGYTYGNQVNNGSANVVTFNFDITQYNLQDGDIFEFLFKGEANSADASPNTKDVEMNTLIKIIKV